MKGEKHQDKGKEQPWEKGDSGKWRVYEEPRETEKERAENREGEGRPAEREGRGKREAEGKSVEKRSGGIWPKSREVNQSQGPKMEEGKEQEDRGKVTFNSSSN